MEKQRESSVQKCLHDLNQHGLICVPEALRLLHCARNRIIGSVDQMTTTTTISANHAAYCSLFAKQGSWYFGEQCDKGLLSAVFRSAVEFVFDVDLFVNPQDHWLVFHDLAGGVVYEVTDKWFDFWFVIVKIREGVVEEEDGYQSEDTVRVISDEDIMSYEEVVVHV